MKKISFLLIFLFAAMTATQAQHVFNKGDLMLNAGIGNNSKLNQISTVLEKSTVEGAVVNTGIGIGAINVGAGNAIEANQAVYITLRQQYEIAKIEEAQERLLINILDIAEPAVKKDKPKRLLILIICIILSILNNITVTLHSIQKLFDT